jgi:serine/threonine protein kinase
VAESFDFNLERLTTFTHGKLTFYLVMEPLVKDKLTAFMTDEDNGVQLTDIKICTIEYNVFDGLALIPEQGFIHNDVKHAILREVRALNAMGTHVRIVLFPKQ